MFLLQSETNPTPPETMLLVTGEAKLAHLGPSRESEDMMSGDSTQVHMSLLYFLGIAIRSCNYVSCSVFVLGVGGRMEEDVMCVFFANYHFGRLTRNQRRVESRYYWVPVWCCVL